MSMEKFNLGGYADKFYLRKSELAARQPQRPSRGKATRLFIDNEYFAKGYAAFFPSSTTVVYLVLSKYANQRSQTCFPSIGRIGREIGTTSHNTVINALKILEGYNLIAVSRAVGRGSNLYKLVDVPAWVPVKAISLEELRGRKLKSRSKRIQLAVSKQPP